MNYFVLLMFPSCLYGDQENNLSEPHAGGEIEKVSQPFQKLGYKEKRKVAKDIAFFLEKKLQGADVDKIGEISLNESLIKKMSIALYSIVKDENSMDFLEIIPSSPLYMLVKAILVKGVHPEAPECWKSAVDFTEQINFEITQACVDKMRQLIEQNSIAAMETIVPLDLQGDEETVDIVFSKLQPKASPSIIVSRGTSAKFQTPHRSTLLLEARIPKCGNTYFTLYEFPEMNFIRVQQFPDCFDINTYQYFTGHCAAIIYRKKAKDKSGISFEYSADGKIINCFSRPNYLSLRKKKGIKVRIYSR